MEVKLDRQTGSTFMGQTNTLERRKTITISPTDDEFENLFKETNLSDDDEDWDDDDDIDIDDEDWDDEDFDDDEDWDDDDDE